MKKKSWFTDDVWELCAGCKEEHNFPSCHCVGLCYDEPVNTVEVFDCDKDIIRQTAQLYCDIWKEPPWNEFFWKVDEVTSDLSKNIKSNDSIVLVATKRNEVVGFSWGSYIDQKKMSIISSGTNLNCLFLENPLVYYINELAVSPEARCSGIGSQLVRAMIKSVEKKTSANALMCLRTDKSAISARGIYFQAGFTDTKIADKKHNERTYLVRS